MSDKICVNVDELTLEEQAEAKDKANETPDRAGNDIRLIAAYVWVWQRRHDPTFTYEQAARLRNSQWEMVNESPEVSGAGNGATPAKSPESGTLTLSES